MPNARFLRRLTLLVLGIFLLSFCFSFFLSSQTWAKLSTPSHQPAPLMDEDISAKLALAPPHPKFLEKLKKENKLGELARIEKIMREARINVPSRVKRGKPPSMAPEQQGALALAPVVAQAKVLAVLVDFSDRPGNTAKAYFEDLLFGDHQGTLRNYYLANSYGWFNLQGRLISSDDLGLPGVYIRLPRPLTYYTNNSYGTGSYPQNSQGLVRDVINILNNRGFDWSPYRSPDGTIPYLIIIHAGPDTAITGNPNDLWSHKGELGPYALTVNTSQGPATVNEYIIAPELGIPDSSSSIGYAPATVGVIAHEFGHILGLPDLYDTSYQTQGVGDWSLMSSGSWLGAVRGGYLDGSCPAELDAFSKMFLGWVNLNIPKAGVLDFQFPPVEQTPTVMMLLPGGKETTDYFLVENRQKIGYDAYLPGSGLLVWHVDGSIMNPDSVYWQLNEVNSIFPPHHGLVLVEADGQFNLLRSYYDYNANFGEASDPFPGSLNKTNWGPFTNPSSSRFDNSPSNVALSNVTPSGSPITADVAIRSHDVAWVIEQTPKKMTAGKTYPASVTMANTGSYSWGSSGSNPFRLSYHIFDTKGNRIIWDGLRTSLPGDVPPGQQITLSAQIQAPTQPGDYVLQWDVVQEGITWFSSNGAPTKNVTIAVPEYDLTWDSDATPTSIGTDQTIIVPLTITNTGGITWPSGGSNPVRISYHWLDSQGNVKVWDGLRTGLPRDIAPGEKVAVSACLKAPGQPGIYTLRWDLVREGIAWFSRAGAATRDVVVTIKPSYDMSWDAASVPEVMAPSKFYTADIKVTNNGAQIWTSGGNNPFRLSYHWVDAAGKVVVFDGLRTFLPADVAPGQQVSLAAVVQAPPKPGKCTLKWDMVHEGVAWFSSKGVPTKDMAVTVTDDLVRWNISAIPDRMAVGERYQVSITIVNEGSTTWLASGSNPVRLSYHWRDTATDRVVVWDGLRTQLPNDVAPGQQVTITAQLKAPDSTGNYVLEWDLVREGVTWFGWKGSPTARSTVQVTKPYLVRWISEDTPTKMAAGALYQVTVTLINEGVITWKAGGSNPYRLSYHWQDSNGKILIWDGIRTALPSDIAPGQQVTLTARVKAPDKPGSYKLIWDMVYEGVTWFSSQGAATKEVLISIPAYDVTWKVHNTPASMTAGQTYAVSLTIVNSGGITWITSGSNPVRVSYHWVDASGNLVTWDGLRSSLPADVAPGQEISLTAQVRAPGQRGNYILKWDLVQEGVTWFSWKGANILDVPVRVEN